MLMYMNREISETVRKIADSRGLTQKQLADRTGLTQPAISRLLRGDRKGDPESWQRIFDVLGLVLTVRARENGPAPAWQGLAGLLDDPAFITTEPGEIDRILGEAQEREYQEAVAGQR